MQETDITLQETNCPVHKTNRTVKKSSHTLQEANSIIQKAYNDNLWKTRPKRPTKGIVPFYKCATSRYCTAYLIDHSRSTKMDGICQIVTDQISSILCYSDKNAHLMRGNQLYFDST